METIEFDENVDKTTIYQNNRYFSYCKAYCRFSKYPIVELKLLVFYLTVHFLNQKTLIYELNLESSLTDIEN